MDRRAARLARCLPGLRIGVAALCTAKRAAAADPDDRKLMGAH
ncbi:hypothetical protein [Streptomyces sp. E2N166]|nr:hypothetical protein [Streptomyces sp. E2N166]